LRGRRRETGGRNKCLSALEQQQDLACAQAPDRGALVHAQSDGQIHM
jgi:hypothetical protein